MGAVPLQAGIYNSLSCGSFSLPRPKFPDQRPRPILELWKQPLFPRIIHFLQKVANLRYKSVNRTQSPMSLKLIYDLFSFPRFHPQFSSHLRLGPRRARATSACSSRPRTTCRGYGSVLNLRTAASPKCEAVPRRDRISGS